MIRKVIKKENDLTIVFISDTHSKHEELVIPRCDILVHSGDYTQVGSPQEIMQFYNWLKRQTQCKHKVFIEGNHDMHADPTEPIAKNRFFNVASYEDFINRLKELKLEEDNIHRLFNSSITIEGVKFWGSPYTPYFHGWGFNSTTDELIQNWNQVPNDTDILVSHGPPNGHLDVCKNGDVVGDVALMQKILEVRPSICAFGHIHESNGIHTIGIGNEKKVTLINASSLDEFYRCTNKPVKIIYNKTNNYVFKT